MNDLIAAAKAVIDGWNSPRLKDYMRLDECMTRLKATVEQAEKQEAKGFDEWWVTPNGCLNKYECETAWTAAQQAERERIRARVVIAKVEGRDDA